MKKLSLSDKLLFLFLLLHFTLIILHYYTDFIPE